MAGTAARSPMTRSGTKRQAGSTVVAAARPGDDDAVRELLRRRAMGGAIRLTLEREPSVRLAAGVEGERHHTVVARHRGTGRVLGMGSRAVRRVWVDGERVLMGYLGQLRLAPELTAGRRLLAAGYDACDRRRRDDELPYDLTSIVADNAPARRLLERGLPGLPCYHRLCRLITLTIPAIRRPPSPARRAGPIQPASEATLPAIVRCLDRNLRRYRYAPAWTEADLRSPTRTRGLEAGDFLVAGERGVPGRGDPGRGDPGRVTGCLAIWDQRGYKQVVVRDYAPALRRFRPLVNLLLAIAGRPRLPPPGHTLDLAYLSHFAVDGDRPEVAVELIRDARREAARRGLGYLVLSLTEANPMLAAIRRGFPARELESILYLVYPSGGTKSRPPTSGACPYVEAATL